MANLIIIVVLLIIIIGASVYVIKAKKKGVKCIGCPAGGNCPSKNGGASGCSCGGQSNTKAEN